MIADHSAGFWQIVWVEHASWIDGWILLLKLFSLSSGLRFYSLLSYSQRHNRKVVFAYLLLPGINDRSSDIRQLAKWFKGKNVMINVLQYNPTSNSKIRAPQKQEMVAFKHQLEQTGLEVTMRVSHGREIKAACGQLANTYNKAKKQQK